MSYYDRRNVSALVGKTLSGIKRTDEELVFEIDGKPAYRMYHDQDCCESVYIESVIGDIRDLIGEPILVAEEATSDKNPDDVKPERIEYQDSFTWTFYKFATRKGYVDVRWYGTSNGYYSESVTFQELS